MDFKVRLSSEACIPSFLSSLCKQVMHQHLALCLRAHQQTRHSLAHACGILQPLVQNPISMGPCCSKREGCSYLCMKQHCMSTTASRCGMLKHCTKHKYYEAPPESLLIVCELDDKGHLKGFLQVLCEHEGDEMPQVKGL